jgi:hypothetical protein
MQLTGGQWFYFHSDGRRAADLYRPRPGLKPQTFGSIANTLTTIPPRTICWNVTEVAQVNALHYFYNPVTLKLHFNVWERKLFIRGNIIFHSRTSVSTKSQLCKEKRAWPRFWLLQSSDHRMQILQSQSNVCVCVCVCVCWHKKCFVFGGVKGLNLGSKTHYDNDVYHDFIQYLHANTGIVP